MKSTNGIDIPFFIIIFLFIYYLNDNYQNSYSYYHYGPSTYIYPELLPPGKLFLYRIRNLYGISLSYIKRVCFVLVLVDILVSILDNCITFYKQYRILDIDTIFDYLVKIDRIVLNRLNRNILNATARPYC